MEDVERLLKGTVAELDRLLDAKNVLGAPIEKDGITVIPMVSYGFGFGVGGGNDQKKGQSSGTGAGGGIKPIGAIIIDKDGVRVESIQGAATSLIRAIGETVTHVMDRSSTRKDETPK